MAIYTKGTISVDASGVVTGVGTKWRDALSLIRIGATLVNLSPMKFYTISSIVSDTELRTLNGDGVAVPAGSNYVILLHDSITVDGLAQDVSETLRYYQSSETEIAQGLDIIKDFDWNRFEQVQVNAAESASAAEQSNIDAQQAKVDAQQARTDTTQLKADTESIKAETNQIKTETNQIKTDTGLILNDAISARDDAVTAKADSESARDLSKQYADSINPSLLLAKSSNLSDVDDRDQAWLNIRPVNSTPLSADPVNPLDAATKGWTETKYGNGLIAVSDKYTVKRNTPTLPPVGGNLIGGGIISDATVGDSHRSSIAIAAKEVIGGSTVAQLTTDANGTVRSETIATREYYKWMFWNDPAISPYISILGESSPSELLVRMGEDTIEIKGMWRKSDISTTQRTLALLNAPLPGYSKVADVFQMIILRGSQPVNNVTTMSQLGAPGTVFPNRINISGTDAYTTMIVDFTIKYYN